MSYSLSDSGSSCTDASRNQLPGVRDTDNQSGWRSVSDNNSGSTSHSPSDSGSTSTDASSKQHAGVLHYMLESLSRRQRGISVALAVASWGAALAWGFYINNAQPIMAYTVQDGGRTDCPGNTLFSHVNETGTYCLSTVGWLYSIRGSNTGLPGSDCEDFDQQGYGYLENPVSAYAHCSIDSSDFVFEYDVNTFGVPFVNYTCIGCSMVAKYTPGDAPCHPCICKSSNEAHAYMEQLFPDYLYVMVVTLTALWATLNTVYYIAVAPGHGRKGWVEFVSTGLFDTYSTIALVAVVTAPAEEFYLYPESGVYTLNTFGEEGEARYLASWGLISLGCILVAENSMAGIMYFTERAENSPTHHEETWHVKSSCGCYAASIFVILLALGTVLDIVNSSISSANGECTAEGHWHADQVVAPTFIVAGTAIIILVPSVVVAGFCGFGRIIPTCVSLLSLAAIRVPNLLSSVQTLVTLALTAWSVSTASGMVSLWLGVC